MILDPWGITNRFGVPVVPSGWRVVHPEWGLCSDCCVTIAKWLPLSDPGFLHALKWVARNIGSSNSEHSVLFPSCFPSPLILELTVPFYFPFSLPFPSPLGFSPPLHFLLFPTWLVKWNQSVSPPQLLQRECTCLSSCGMRRGRSFFCSDVHLSSAQCFRVLSRECLS